MFHRGLLHGHRRLKNSRVKWSAVSALEPRRVDNRAFLFGVDWFESRAWLLVRGRASVVATCYFLRCVGGILLRSLSKKRRQIQFESEHIDEGRIRVAAVLPHVVGSNKICCRTGDSTLRA